MALFVVGNGGRIDVVGDAVDRVFAESHDPGEKEITGGAEGGLGESGVEFIDDGLQGKYHSPHGGTSCLLTIVDTHKNRRNPFNFIPADAQIW